MRALIVLLLSVRAVRLDPARLYGVLPGAEAEKYTISDCLLTTAPHKGRAPAPP